ncbi:ATP-binding cassette domain-containing protein [Amycolatopsis sp. GA6-003]|uniref:ATP-binding cassette domain-containing protein n=1 Tax=Amycolatopsis sp. GA6-003 TaxID=2652444 RepID=UPI0039172F6F
MQSGVQVTARGLGVRGPQGPVFENVDLDVPAGAILVVHGAAGTGRTCLLLALAGRMRLNSGAVRVGAHLLPDDHREVRRTVAVASAGPALELEPRLRVDELIAERTWLAPGVTTAAVRDALDVVGLDVPGKATAEELGTAKAVRLALALSLAERPGAIVLDDLDRECTPDQRREVWAAAGRVAASGVTLLASSVGPAPADLDTFPLALPALSTDRLPGDPAPEEAR